MTQARKDAAQNRKSDDSRPSRNTEVRRPQRVPVAQARDKLTVTNGDPNRVYRWVKDMQDGHRVLKFQNAGYVHETDPNLIIGHPSATNTEGEGSPLRSYAGVNKEGKAEYLYLMSISKEWYDEDQELKNKKIDAREDQMLRPPEGVDYVKEASVRSGFTRKINR